MNLGQNTHAVSVFTQHAHDITIDTTVTSANTPTARVDTMDACPSKPRPRDVGGTPLLASYLYFFMKRYEQTEKANRRAF